MKSGMSYTLAAATLFALAIPAQAEPPRTLVPVADPGSTAGQPQGSSHRSRRRFGRRRKALQVAAPKLSERLDNLAEAVKRLEEQTNEITEAVAKDAQTKPEETKELLAEQESINQRLERAEEALRRDANAQDASQKKAANASATPMTPWPCWRIPRATPSSHWKRPPRPSLRRSTRLPHHRCPASTRTLRS